jgi:hypothetical protein
LSDRHRISESAVVTAQSDAAVYTIAKKEKLKKKPVINIMVAVAAKC